MLNTSLLRVDKCCTDNYLNQTIFHNKPPLLSFILPDFRTFDKVYYNVKFNEFINIQINPNKQCKLYLKSIIYFGESHFTIRIIDKNFFVWYFDSLNGESILEKHLSQFSSKEIIECYNRYASCIIYSKSL